MAKHSMPEMKEGSVNVTPLIDVVMCLIIFFMLVAKIGVSTGAAKMELPETILGKKIEDLGPNLVVNVLYDPQTPINDPTTGQPKKNEKGQIMRRRLPDAYSEILITAMVDQFQGKGEAKEIQLRKQSTSGGVDFPFRRALEAIIKGDPKRGIKPQPDFAITLRAERDMEYRLLQLVLAEIAQAGVKNVNYASVGKKMVEAAPAQ